MGKPKQVNVRRRLIWAFSTLVLIFSLYGLFTIFDIHSLSSLTRTIYNHPLAVSNAALQSNVSISKMHRSMKDVVLLTSPSRINRAIKAVNEQEQRVYKDLDIVRERIIGNEGKTLENETRKLFDNWRPIREEVIEFVRRGEIESAAAITVGKGANHVALLEEKMLGLTNYAKRKASDFMKETELVHSRVNLTLIVFLLLSILTSFLVALFTIKRIGSSEKELHESEERYRSLIENQTDLICRFIPDGTFIFVNQVYCRFFNKAEEELIGNKWHPLPVDDDVTHIQEKLSTLSPTNPIVVIENRVFSGKGDIHWVQFANKGFFDRHGSLQEIQSVGRDITERKRAEEAMRESEKKFRTLFDTSPNAIGLTEIKSGKLIDVNDKLCRLTKSTKDEILGRTTTELGFYSDVDRNRFISELNNSGKVDGLEMEFKTKDGAILDARMFAVPIQIEGETFILTEFHDITEERRLEAQLQQTQKMEAIATLAGGVAHEFNNALMGLVGNIELLKMDLPEDERRNKYFERMNRSNHRMSRLTDQLLAYAEGGKYQPKDLKLDDFVIETLPILQYDLKPAIRVETHFSKDTPHIKADNAQIQMVMSAILANANEAIEDEGLIRITAENKDVDEDFAKQHPGLKPGFYGCLTVEDDGKGMDEEARVGIFEPFFTTKFQGRGMGMAAVYGIVKNHEGWIYVDSEFGKGTMVRIYLPAIEIAAEKPKKTKAEVVRGSGTILMIEDEDVVAEVTQAMLEKLGYRVIVAKTGKDAIHISETFDGQIDLALLDIKLPDIDGSNLYPLIMKTRSNLKVIVCSGYSIDGPARKILDAGAQDFIQKPFSLATLSEKLKAVLEGK